MGPDRHSIREARTLSGLAHRLGVCGGSVVWRIVAERSGWRAWPQERKNRARPRAYSMAARKSTNWGSVSPRTLTGPNACHSLKPAERGPMGAHSLQALSALLGAPRGLSAVIRVSDRLGKNRSRTHSEHHLAQHSELHLARNSRLQLTAHGERHKLARKGKGEKLAQHGKDHPAWHSEHHKLAREGRRHKLRGAVGVTNCAAELATFKGQKCNDQNILWEGQGIIRMPYQIRDADGSAPNDKFRLSFGLVENDSHSQEPLSSTNVLSGKKPVVQMNYCVKMILILSPTGENRAGGLIRP